MVTTNPLDAVADLQAVVTTLAPTLRPQVLPKGVQYGLDILLSLCVSEQQKKTLREAIERHAPANAVGRGVYAIGAFDVARRVYNVENIAWLTQEEALVHEFPRFMELQLHDAEQAKEMVVFFLQQNGHDENDTMVAQQCFNAAFALQTLLRAFPQPPIAINGRLVEMDKSTDVQKVLVDVLFRTNHSTKTDKSSSQPKKAKNKKRKAGSTH